MNMRNWTMPESPILQPLPASCYLEQPDETRAVTIPDAETIRAYILPPLATLQAANSEATRVATYRADMIEWHARQARAANATREYNKHYFRNDNTAPTPKPLKTTYDKGYYEGGFRMVIDGIPIRMAAHVKVWKLANRQALCQGFDPWGLTIRPHGKHGFTDTNNTAYWNSYHKTRDLETIMPGAECIDLINSGEYRKWRPMDGLFDARRAHERHVQRQRDRASLGPNLFQAARIARHKATATA